MVVTTSTAKVVSKKKYWLNFCKMKCLQKFVKKNQGFGKTIAVNNGKSCT